MNISWTRVFISFVALFAWVGGWIADLSETHIFNPHWSPHAKFHNGQTLSFGALLGVLTLYYCWTKSSNPRQQIVFAGICGALYWVAIWMAGFFPGVAPFDPEFAALERIELFGIAVTQPRLGFVLVVLVAWATWHEWRTLQAAEARSGG